jgi:hypothetical protein
VSKVHSALLQCSRAAVRAYAHSGSTYPAPCQQLHHDAFCSLQVRNLLNKLELSNEAVLVREHVREAAYGKVQAPWFIRLPFSMLCWTLDVVFNNRPIQRCAFI